MEWGRAEEKVDPCCAPPRAHYVRKWNNAGYRRPGLEQSVGALRRPLSGVIRRRKRSLLPLGEVASATSTTSLLQYFRQVGCLPKILKRTRLWEGHKGYCVIKSRTWRDIVIWHYPKVEEPTTSKASHIKLSNTLVVKSTTTTNTEMKARIVIGVQRIFQIF